MPSAISDDQLVKQIQKTKNDLAAIDNRITKYRAFIDNAPSLKKELEARLNYLEVIHGQRTPAAAAADPTAAVLQGDPADDPRFTDPQA